jgi:dUTP pyrophosphatase
VSATPVVVEWKRLDARLGNQIPLPAYATDASAAMDLRAAPAEPVSISPGHAALVPTGLAIHIADRGWCALVLPRSGLGHHHGLVLGNLIGLIDADYQGPLVVSCWNRGRQSFTIRPGDRIAQLLLTPVARVEWREVETFVATARGTGGFGSTGVA